MVRTLILAARPALGGDLLISSLISLYFHVISEVWDAVAVCSGLHNVPRIPMFVGQETFGGQIMHSSDYKARRSTL